MKQLILSIILVVTASLSSTAHNHSELTINNKISSVEWVGKKVAGEHHGTVLIKEGTIALHDGQLSGGKVVIDMESITCADLKGEWAEKLINHLKSEDFFSVEKSNSAVLDILKVTPGTDGNSIISGNLTIKGITKPIEFPAKIEVKEGKLVAYAEVKVDRTLYDIKFRSGKFFEGLGDKMISDEFIIKFKIAAQ